MGNQVVAQQKPISHFGEHLKSESLVGKKTYSYEEEAKEDDKDTWNFIQLNQKRLIGRKLREVQVFLMESGIPFRAFEKEKLKYLTGEKVDFRINLEIKNGFVINAFPDSFIVVEIMYDTL